jgi:hypothetical protein
MRDLILADSVPPTATSGKGSFSGKKSFQAAIATLHREQ